MANGANFLFCPCLSHWNIMLLHFQFTILLYRIWNWLCKLLYVGLRVCYWNNILPDVFMMIFLSLVECDFKSKFSPEGKRVRGIEISYGTFCFIKYGLQTNCASFAVKESRALIQGNILLFWGTTAQLSEWTKMSRFI